MRPRSKLVRIAWSGATAIVLIGSPSAVGASGTATQISVSDEGMPGNARSADSAISADGSVIAFESLASNLVSGDTNGFNDIFVHHRPSGTTTLVSVASDGTQGNDDSAFHEFVGDVAISANGRFVVFPSDASNLVDDDSNGREDVFLHDRDTGITERVSVSSLGTQSTISGSHSPSVSADGRFVAFVSSAADLVVGDLNGAQDVFVRDRDDLGTTTLASVSSTGEQANDRSSEPSISADGRLVAFRSSASNLVPGDSNDRPDIFVRDLIEGTTERVSAAFDEANSDGYSFEPSISADGKFVAFRSSASNLVSGQTNGDGDVFVRDLEQGTTEHVSIASDGTPGDGFSGNPSISADGRFVAFQSFASNLIPDDTNGNHYDIFVHDRWTGTTTLASHQSDGTSGNFFSLNPSISADGSVVAYHTSFNISPGDVWIHEAIEDVPPQVGKITGSGTVPGKNDSGAATFDLTVQSDGVVVKGAIRFDDPGAGVLIRSSDLSHLSIQAGTTCSITGTAWVTREGQTTTENFTLTCEDNGQPGTGDIVTIETPSYSGGGLLISGNIRVHP